MKKLFFIFVLAIGHITYTHYLPEAFALLKEGKYDAACALIGTAYHHDVLDARDGHENTLLGAAILYADALDALHDDDQKIRLLEKTIDCILDKTGFDWYIDRRNTVWHTPLMIAAQKGLGEIAEYLYIRGANPRMKDVYGKKASDYAAGTPLRTMLLSWEWEFQRIRYEYDNMWYVLRCGMYRVALTHVIPHLSELESLSMRDKLGNSLIAGIIIFSFAIDKNMSYPHKEQLLIDLMDAVYELIPDPIARSMLLDVQNKRGQTALMWAVKYGLEGIVTYLVHRGADLLLRDAKGRQTVDYAQTAQLKALLEDWQIKQELGYRI